MRWVSAAAILLVLASCNDPKDPQTWIKRLRDREHATDAIKRLQQIGDPVAVKPLCDLFRDYPSPNILKAIVSFKDRNAIPTLISALEFGEGEEHNGSIAARALGRFKATEAVDALTKLAERKVAPKSRANIARLAAIAALVEIGDRKAVPALIRILQNVSGEQDFSLNQRAAEALGQLGDPRAVRALIGALFVVSRLQATTFPMARVALAQIGEPAVEALVVVVQGQDGALRARLSELSDGDAVAMQKAAIVLGDIRSRKAVGPLLKALAKPGTAERGNMGVIEALGRLGDRRAVAPLISLLSDQKASFQLRAQACRALTLLGDKRALPVLLSVAEKGFLAGGLSDLRAVAAVAYGRLVGKEIKKDWTRLEALAKDPKLERRSRQAFSEALVRAELAKTCGDDSACYAQQLLQEQRSLVRREKAAIMLGVLGKRTGVMDALTAALPAREPILRLFLLESAKRLGRSVDKKLVAAIKELADKDSKRRAAFLGGDLASADKIALAAILRKP